MTRNIFMSQTMKWKGDINIMMNKTTIKVVKTKENSHITSRTRYRRFSNRGKLLKPSAGLASQISILNSIHSGFPAVKLWSLSKNAAHPLPISPILPLTMSSHDPHAYKSKSEVEESQQKFIQALIPFFASALHNNQIELCLIMISLLWFKKYPFNAQQQYSDLLKVSVGNL